MQRASDRWLSSVLSVLLHAALLAALVYGWLLYRRPARPTPTLAIEATVVDGRTLRGAQQHAAPMTPAAAAPQPAPPPEPAPEASGPPQPTPEELAAREQQHEQAEAAAAQERRLAEERAAAERKAREAAEAAEAQKRAEEAQRQAEAQEDSERQAELKRSLAAEEQASAARSGPALANWQAQIAAKITRAWLRPPTARQGIECQLYVTQVPGGAVTQVSIGRCNGDQAVRDSIEAAVYRASPLPPPPDPTLFDRNLRIDFKPD